MKNLVLLLVRHEGFRPKPYKDSMGKTTIGIGRNLEDVGISRLEAGVLLANDINRVTKEAVDTFPWFKSLDLVRQDAVLDMLFNLGLTKFCKFAKFIELLQNQNYERASEEMLNSLWAQQVGVRAKELSRMILTGFYPEGLNENE